MSVEFSLEDYLNKKVFTDRTLKAIILLCMAILLSMVLNNAIKIYSIPMDEKSLTIEWNNLKVSLVVFVFSLVFPILFWNLDKQSVKC